jgi:hypothetical protein
MLIPGNGRFEVVSSDRHFGWFFVQLLVSRSVVDFHALSRDHSITFPSTSFISRNWFELHLTDRQHSVLSSSSHFRLHAVRQNPSRTALGSRAFLV